MTKFLVTFLFLVALNLNAGNLFKFRFTREDGSEWECQKANHGSENPILIATNQAAIGTNMPAYGGHNYRIDTDAQILVIDESHWVALTMPDPSWQIQPQHGFAVSINSGAVTYFDYVGPYSGTPFRANGLVIIQYP